MIANMLITVLYLSLLLNSGLTINVLQSGDQVSQPGVKVILECSLGPGFSMQFLFMYWYRQNHYAAPIEYLLSELDFSEGHFQMSIDQDKNYFSLEIDEVFLNDSSIYYCVVEHVHCDSGYEAHFGQGTKLTVLEPGQAVKSPKVKVFRPSSKECRNPIDNEREKTLVCVASDFYPDHVSVYWQIIQLNVTSGVTTDEAALRKDKVYTITSRLKVSAEDWYKPEWNFECIVRFFNGTHDTDYKDSISGEQGPDILTREKYLRITRQAKLSYSVLIIKSSVYGAFVAFLVWRLQSSAEKQNH
ncbi:T-cell receptor beta-2 chain C region isoform X7 [Paralichthys olivaceus]|uniref:T-cell receptor beta-2 chain C region isoform X7 n=1 Tax=Paralichthys olivaceus TaxID=8255 RepID=UPI0037527171